MPLGRPYLQASVTMQASLTAMADLQGILKEWTHQAKNLGKTLSKLRQGRRMCGAGTRAKACGSLPGTCTPKP